MTGAGKLSSKLLTTLMVAVFASGVWAADNSIYINQSGDTSTITMTQDGAGNVVRGVQGVGGGNTTPATINGDSNTVTVNQIGTGNTLNFGIQTTIANGTPLQNGNTFLYTVTGNNNVGIIDSNNDGGGVSASNYISINQTSWGNVANMNVLGSNNSITAVTSGGNGNSVTSTTNGDSNTQNITVSGGGANQITVNQGIGGSAVASGSTATTNNNGTATINVTGVSNVVAVAQTSAGFADTTVLNINGSSNVANIVQNASTGNTTVNISSSGNGNHFSINSNAH